MAIVIVQGRSGVEREEQWWGYAGMKSGGRYEGREVERSRGVVLVHA